MSGGNWSPTTTGSTAGPSLVAIGHNNLNAANTGSPTSGQTSVLFRIYHYFPAGASRIQLSFPGYYQTTAGDTETPWPNGCTIQAAIEGNDGSHWTCTSGGSATLTANPSAQNQFDPMAVILPAGANWIRVWVQIASGSIPGNWQVQGGTPYGGVAEGFKNNPATIFDTVSNGYNQALMPVVRGLPLGANPGSLAIVGDSILDQGGEATALNSALYPVPLNTVTGWPGLAAYQRWGVVGTQHPSYSLTNLMSAGKGAGRLNDSQWTQFVLCNFGINDLINGLVTTLAQFQGLVTTLAQVVHARGQKLIYSTLIPCNTGAPYPGNTPVLHTWEAVRVACNNWLRSGSAPIDYLFDPDQIIDPGATGFWPMIAATFTGTVSAVTNGSTQVWNSVITPNGSPTWTVNQFAQPADGLGPLIVQLPARNGGLGYNVWANTTGTVEIGPMQAGTKPYLAGITAGDTLNIGDFSSFEGVHPTHRWHQKLANAFVNQFGGIV